MNRLSSHPELVLLLEPALFVERYHISKVECYTVKVLKGAAAPDK